MQTLRKKSSPCKYKNEPSRFLGDGMTFKAKLIGILEVNEARGDKMCQDALNDLKTAIRAAGEHKQRITISISIEGLRLRDEKTGESMYHHPVHKISFIAQDMSDSRAFGYIFGSPDTGHRFFGIKTDKTASQVVIAMRDLFQVVFELKKKEIEMAKHHIEQHQLKFGGSSYSDHPLKDEVETERPKTLKTNESRSRTSSSSMVEAPASRNATSEVAGTSRNSGAIADLLDLEDELNSIQQGISQMDRITPSDPFGPLGSKGESFLESFKEKSLDLPSLPKPTTLGRRSVSQGSNKDPSELEKSGNNFNSTTTASNRAPFFPQFPGNSKKLQEETHWFDQETESLFSDAVANPTEPVASPVTFHTPTGDPDLPTFEEKKSPLKTDLFTDLDPLGTGKVKPYLDKKDFFQELKNPPKKVLKELISEPGVQDPAHFFPADFDGQKSSQSIAPLDSSVIKTTLASASSNILNSFPSKESKYSRIDPFEDTDPFENTDPFLEESFPKSIGFPPLLTAKASVDVVQERVTFRYDKVAPQKCEDRSSPSPSKSSIFSSSIHGPLRVSLPPEKQDTNTTISLSSLASRFRSSPSPTDDSKSHRRKHYQTLKQSNGDKSDDQSQSPILEEVYMRGSPKSFTVNSFDKKYFVGSPPPSRSDKVKGKMSGSLELLDSTPDPPPRPKTALFAIKPPPLPPKKQNQPNFRPPARPPSLEENNTQYDYLRKIEVTSKPRPSSGSTIETSPKKRGSSPSQMYASKLERKNSYENCPTKYPLIAPPPQRKTPTESNSRPHSVTTPGSLNAPSPEMKETSVLNITLNQLDQSGFESLAATLGVPTENVCNMTLQELTKMLAQKYLGTSNLVSSEPVKNDDSTFHADFESNFGDGKPSNFDKYAAFKELIDEKVTTLEGFDLEKDLEKAEDIHANNDDIQPLDRETCKEEDKYAALRQLSLCAQKSENLSEDLDISNEEDSSARADNISDIIKHHTDDSFTPLHNMEMNESPIAKIPLEDSGEIGAEVENTAETPMEEVKDKKNTWPPYEEPSSVSFEKESKSFFESSADGKVEPFEDANDSWATFEKEPMKESEDKKDDKVLVHDNEQSPLSSDGKDDLKGTANDWARVRSESNRRDVPWNDDDESWDDYSPKESYWSDESSHDGQSPIKENLSFHRKAWNKHQRPAAKTKGPASWSENPPTWHRRWQDDTEDEYEEMWRKRRQRPSSFDRERKKEKGYEGFGWSRERDVERFNRGFHTERRKPIETVGEYRRRCDSDASDKEYVALDRTYPDGMGEKDKDYYMYQRQAMERHWTDQRESRSKYKKQTGHKRPSSASEAKRYEKMYSGVDPRSIDKPVEGESEEEEYSSRFHSSRRDPRYHSNMEYYGSYDRRAEAVYQRRMQRGRRGGHGPGKDYFMSPTTEKHPHHEKLHFFPPDTPRSNKSEDTPEPSKELHFKFEDDFIPSPAETSPSPRVESAPERRRLVDDWGRKRTEGLPLSSDNNNGRFSKLNEDCEILSKDKAKSEGSGVTKKPSLKGKNHLFGRQDSSTSLRKSESINIFSRENDPFEDDDFFSSGASPNGAKLSKFFSEKSKSNTNVSDPFAWKDMFGNC